MSYGTATVLDGIDLTVRTGEIVALLGPNGAGKTTTIEILEGFRDRSAGDVGVLGVDPARGDDAWRARIGLVLQNWRDHGAWTVLDLLNYQASLYAPYTARRGVTAWTTPALLASVDLTDLAARRIRTLSGGQRRRLDLALGLVGGPELLFLDEPTAGLDPRARRDFHGLVRRAVAQLGTTVLITTHDLWEADALADRILILVAGRVVAEGSVTDLVRQIAGRDRVRYTWDRRSHDERVDDATAYVRSLFREEQGRDGLVGDLEVRPASLEDTYLALVRSAEADAGEQVAPAGVS